MTIVATFTKLVAGAALVAILAGAALGPAQAQGATWRFGSGSDAYDRNPDNPRGVPQLGICQTDYQVRRVFTNAGYDKVLLGAKLSSKRVQVKAIQGKKTYLINYNRCTAEIVDSQRIR